MLKELWVYRRNIFRPYWKRSIGSRYVHKQTKPFDGYSYQTGYVECVSLGVYWMPIARFIANIMHRFGYSYKLRGRGCRTNKPHDRFTKDIRVRDSLFAGVYAYKVFTYKSMVADSDRVMRNRPIHY